MKNVSLIISVYKDAESLAVILEALKFQTYKHFDVIVSEDGESDIMRQFLQSHWNRDNITHVTQPDVGWRKNRALNNSIKNSKGEYLIFIDGDCVPHHRFVENHVRFAARKTVVAGRRVKLGPRFSRMFRDEIGHLLRLERKVVTDFRAMRKDGARFYEEGIYVSPDSWLGKVLSRRKFRTIKGCNMSFHKTDIESINGFDEDYELPAVGEDIDLIWRFQAAGFQFRSVKNFCVQYHLHHRENWTDNSINERMMREKMDKGEFVCRNGLSKVEAHF